MRPPRSYLYVPGDRPDRLAKAFTRGADALIVDLEDAVPVEAKERALQDVLSWLDTVAAAAVPVWVRVNSGERREEEVLRLAAHPRVHGLCLPKTESAAEVEDVDRLLQRAGRPIGLAPLIESAVGVVNVHAIAAAPGVQLLHLGEVDLAADLGLTPGPGGEELLLVRSLIVVASRAARLGAPPAPVSTRVDDPEDFRSSTQALAALGFVGRACIHPRQVAVANHLFDPDPVEQAWARAVLGAAERSGQGAFRADDGTMVDEAVLRRARGILGH